MDYQLNQDEIYALIEAEMKEDEEFRCWVELSRFGLNICRHISFIVAQAQLDKCMAKMSEATEEVG